MTTNKQMITIEIKGHYSSRTGRFSMIKNEFESHNFLISLNKRVINHGIKTKKTM